MKDRPALPPPRKASLRPLYDPAAGAMIDRALVLWFPGPASASGEDMAEIHCHGGPAVIAAFCRVLAALPGLRPAGPGEFSRRAFANRRLDLTRAEGLADLIAAECEAQRAQALAQSEGSLGRLYEDWRERLIEALAAIEAAIDFSDEELPGGLIDGVRATAAALAGEIGAHLGDRRRGERLRSGWRVAITGAPNVGKSSLLNAIARRDVAIVSATPGTTRDVLEAHLDLDGYPVTFEDTAGICESTDAIEAEGVRRALVRAAAADLRLDVVAVDNPAPPAPAEPGGPPILRVLNKIDLLKGAADKGATFAISARSGAGLGALLAEIGRRVAADLRAGDHAVLTRQRHRRQLEVARERLREAAGGAAGAPELLAEDLRLAARALGAITGRIDVEDVLDRVFAGFCIGK